MNSTVIVLSYIAIGFLLVPSVHHLVKTVNPDLSPGASKTTTGILSVFWPLIVGAFLLLPIVTFIIAPYRSRDKETQ